MASKFIGIIDAESVDVSGNIRLTGTATTTNQSRMIDFTGFDKEGTTDFTDRAYIQHTVNTGGHSGSVLVISSQNDAGDGIAFATHASSMLKHNGNTIWTSGNDGSGSGLDADLLDGVQGSSFLRNNVATQEINGGASTSLELRCQDAGQAYLKVGRSTNGSQGTGIIEVSQDGAHGGGFYYNGDGTPVFASGESPDTITFYRIQAGTRHRVFQYGYSSNNVSFTGSITAAGDVTAYSDARLKSDVVTIEGALDKVSQLRGVMYTKDDKPSTGVIAQEVEAVLPEVVHTADDEMGTKSVAYGNMVGLLVEAIKELKDEVAALKAEIAELKK